MKGLVYSVESEMKDVEVFRVLPDCVLAKGKRFGRQWLLRGLPYEKRNDPDSLGKLRDEFGRRYECRESSAPLTVGMEEIEGIGPCIVEEWRGDYPATEGDEANRRGYGWILRRNAIAIAALILLTVAIVAGVHIRSLSMLSKTAKADLQMLRVANRQCEQRMLMLEDSLDRVMNGQLIPEDFAGSVKVVDEDKGERMANTIYQTRMMEFKKELVRYDREVIPIVIEDCPVFLDSICVLYRQMLERGADVDPYGFFPLLPEDDRIRLTANLYGGYMLSFNDYARVWIPKAWEAYKKKKQEKASGNKEGQK